MAKNIILRIGIFLSFDESSTDALITILSGRRKSFIADPSLKNSGLETTSKLAFGFGGYITVPPILVCSILRVPIILHEGNKVIGRANKFLIKFATFLFYHIQC